MTEKLKKRPSGILADKKGLVVGVANRRSLAWSIAKECSRNGAKIAMTWQNDSTRKRVEPLALSIDAIPLCEFDVNDKESASRAIREVEQRIGQLDFVVHAIAYVEKSALSRRITEVTSEEFSTALEISCHSLIELVSKSLPIMNDGGAFLTLTSYGAEKVLPNYHLMGIAKAALEAAVRYLAADIGNYGMRINAISAGPVKTVSATRVPGFGAILEWNRLHSLLRRNVTAEEVATVATFLLSSGASGITGEVLKVDSGHHAQGMHNGENPNRR